MDQGKLRKIKGEFILECIHHQRLKRWWVADQSGLHPTTLRRWMNGSVESGRLHNLTRLAKVLDVNTTELFY